MKQSRSKVIITLICIMAVVSLMMGYAMLKLSKPQSAGQATVVSTDGEVILAEKPQAGLSEQELALAETIFDIPGVKEAMVGKNPAAISEVNALDAFRDVLPAEALIHQSSANENWVMVDYTVGSERTILEYIDDDKSGAVDMVWKTTGVYEGDEVRSVYSAKCTLATGETAYEKAVVEEPAESEAA